MTRKLRPSPPRNLRTLAPATRAQRAHVRLDPALDVQLSSFYFDTAIGTCGLAWTAAGIAWVQLPEATAADTRARLRLRSGAKEVERAPRAIQPAVERLSRYFEGEDVDLGEIPVDVQDATDFERRVYTALVAVPRGQTCTYGELAAVAGEPQAARAVGRAVGKNPVPVLIPCHRVLAAGRQPGGFSAPGGLDTKAKLLALEGVVLPGREPTLFP